MFCLFPLCKCIDDKNYCILQGEWILTCGPLSKDDFEEATRFSHVLKFGSDKYLKKCTFELVPQAMQFEGEVFISAVSLKLFFVISVTDLMTSN